MHAIRPTIFAPFDRLRCGRSTRVGGVSPEPLGMNLSYRVGDEPARVERNREIFFGALGVPVSALAVPGQVHGAVPRHVTAPGEYPECDALVTSVTGVFCCISVADCLPIFLFDPRRCVIAAVHAGWRGTAAGIGAEAVRAMCAAHGSVPDDILSVAERVRKDNRINAPQGEYHGMV